MLHKKIFTSAIFNLICILSIGQITIQEARDAGDGQTVIIEGIILNGSEGGTLRFLQDETAGIALYDGLSGSISLQSLQAGDRVVIEGETATFNGLVELNFINSVDYVSPNNPLPEAKLIEISEIGEIYQSERVIVKCAQINSSFTFFSEGLYELTDQSNTETKSLYVDGNSNLVGENIPDSPFEITAINSFSNEGRLIILENDDLEVKECLGFSQLPKPVIIDKTVVTFEWALTEVANQLVFLGTDPSSLTTVGTVSTGTEISFDIEGLSAGSIYYMQVVIENGLDPIASRIIPFASASNSSGEIEVYFNNSVDASFSDGSTPNGTTAAEFDSRLFQIFDNAKETIDIAMYNINRTIIVNYLIDAYNRGVTIRYIADDETNNNAFEDITPPFGLVYGSSGSPLMHNKFVIVDRDLEDDAKVIMGSTNFTSGQMSTDPNHMVVINDQSLARTYTLEFEEMWGSQDEFPNISEARFGEDKQDNTPHFFNINGISVESYFSPSDGLTDKIEKELRNAENSIDVGLLTLTKNELGTAIRDQKVAGLDIRVIIENFDDFGTEYDFLKSSGVPIKSHLLSPIYHHKLAIFDEGEDGAAVLTGSHNWTNKAEFQNDENTVIIRDQSIANMFTQEYEARWDQLPTAILEEQFQLSVYPNPASDFLRLISDEKIDRYEIYSMSGKLIHSSAAFTSAIDLKGYSAGSYLIRFISEGGFSQKLIIKQ